MNPKYSIKVHPTEKEIYRIFKDLEKHSRTTFSYPDPIKHRRIAKDIGVMGKSLVKNGLMLPPAYSRNHHLNIVALPIGVKIEERKPRRFFFQRV